MQLIGMLDSPYVRRTAISLRLLGLPFEHRPISVFRQFDEFAAINPVVKAPSLVCDDGEVLMDSGLILEYAERLAAPRASLVPKDVREAQHDLRLTGLALAGVREGGADRLRDHPAPGGEAARAGGWSGCAASSARRWRRSRPSSSGRRSRSTARRSRRPASPSPWSGSSPSRCCPRSSPRARIRRSWRMRAAAEALPEFRALAPR